MRCLHCHRSGIPVTQTTCPQCGVHLPSLLRDVLPPGSRLREGTYHIDYALGRGGFGITYRAMHVRLEQQVAIKEFYPREQALRDGATGGLSVATMHKDSYERALKRFMREGQILARMSHRNVVRVQDLFEERGTGYMVMELVSGRTMRELLDAQPGRRLPSPTAWKIMEQLVEALEAVHEKGIYHLDIKPDNVLVKDDGGLVLVDFGAARQGLSSGTSTQAFTVEYAAPEVLACLDVGPQSDLFEVGMMLYEMLTGERPTPALGRVLRDEWKQQPLGEPWQNLVSSALRIDKDSRPRTMREWWQTRGAAATPSPPPRRAPPAPQPPPTVDPRFAREYIAPTPSAPPPAPGAGEGARLHSTPSAGWYKPSAPDSHAHAAGASPGAYSRPETPSMFSTGREEKSGNPIGLVLGGGFFGALLGGLAGRLYWASYWNTIEEREYIKVAAADWNDGITQATTTGAIVGLVGGLLLSLILSVLSNGALAEAGRDRRAKFGALIGAGLAVVSFFTGFYLDQSDASGTSMAAGYMFSGASVAGCIGAGAMLIVLGLILGALSGSSSAER